MSVLNKIARAFALFCVLIVAVAAGLFLASCRAIESSSPKKGPATAPSVPPATRPGTQPVTTWPTVDVDETQKGQPIPRNLME